MDFQLSRTYQNLQRSLDWELQVSSRYSIYADKARDEQYIDIGNLFDTVTKNEKEHSRIWLRLLNNGQIPSTEENLFEASQLERASADMYRNFSTIALEEGYTDIAALFNGVGNIELNHDLYFTERHTDVQQNQVFCKPNEVLWVCMSCGNILSGVCAPEICPVCGFPQGYYRLY